MYFNYIFYKYYIHRLQSKWNCINFIMKFMKCNPAGKIVSHQFNSSVSVEIVVRWKYLIQFFYMGVARSRIQVSTYYSMVSKQRLKSIQFCNAFVYTKQNSDASRYTVLRPTPLNKSLTWENVSWANVYWQKEILKLCLWHSEPYLNDIYQRNFSTMTSPPLVTS